MGLFKKIMNKKKYIAPTMEVMDIESMVLMATSTPHIGIVDPNDPDGSGSDILSNKRRGQWGNLWHEE